ncbi:hypothetical protein D088_900029 [Salmonella enterica subsp. houtenae serovar 16:z4,z32:-- str. RKS3027]|nr:hypothetical protein D088_900029 [Salmonella enterica subsp. houtenae serovar 16:z4,z32:-- str. RKS3027]
MWDETGSVFGNQRIVLANPHPGGFIVNDPTANPRIAKCQYIPREASVKMSS